MDAAEKIAVMEKAVADLKELITSGKIAKGSKLPEEKELAEKLKVGVATVREALLVLQAFGYVDIKRGEGSFAAKVEADAAQRASDWFADHVVQMSDYMEARQIIESRAAALAVQRADADEILEIENIHHEFEKAFEEDDVVALVEADKAFHHAIIKATQNRVLTIINHRIVRFFEKYRIEAFSLKDTRKNTFIQHSNILAAIKNRDAEKATNEMMHHLDISAH